MSDSESAVVILASGSSRRLGTPKQLVAFEGETLLARACRTATEAAVGPVFIVVRPDGGPVLDEARRLGCALVLNDEADEGVAAALRAGVRAVPHTAKGVLLMVCDQPMVTSEHLRELVQLSGGQRIGSAYAGRIGVPAWFPRELLPELLKLRGDAGASRLLRGARSLPLLHGEIDIDTERDLDDLRRIAALKPDAVR